MEEKKLSYETLSQIINFLAKKEGVSMDMYVSSIQKEMVSEAAMEAFFENFQRLSPTQQAQVMRVLENRVEGRPENVANPVRRATSGEYALVELAKKDVGDLVKTKPRGLKIDGVLFETKSWTEVSCEFVKFLIDKKDLRSTDLPLYPSARSAKAFINSFKGQPNGSDSYFIGVADGFYVDTKYNAKYHILNMWGTLKKLKIETKYNIIILL